MMFLSVFVFDLWFWSFGVPDAFWYRPVFTVARSQVVGVLNVRPIE